MMLLQGDFAPFVGLAALAAALAAAAGAAGARSPLSLGLHLMAVGMALGAGLAALGAAGAGLVAVTGLGGAAALLVIAAFALAPRAARVRKDGPPLGSLVVAAALGIGLVFAGADTPALRPAAVPQLSSAEIAPAAVTLLISLGVVALGAAALGAMALLGFGERAESLRAAQRRRKLKAKLPDEEPS